VRKERYQILLFSKDILGQKGEFLIYKRNEIHSVSVTDCNINRQNDIHGYLGVT